MLVKLQTVNTQYSYCLFLPSLFKLIEDSDTFPMKKSGGKGRKCVELNQ